MKFWLILFLFMSRAVWAEPIKVWKEDVAFAPFKTEHVELLSIVELTSFDKRFGGLSSLMIKDDEIISTGDHGHLFRFSRQDMGQCDVVALRDLKGKRLKKKKQRDSESLTLDETGRLLISFERNHRILPYSGEGKIVGDPIPLPSAVEGLPNNGGLEAIETLSDGRLVIVGEGRKRDEEISLWIEGHDKKSWEKKTITRIDEFRPTGLTRLPGRDRLVLLERYYAPITGVRLRLSYLDGITGKRGDILAKLGPPTPLDNFEGIAAYQEDNGQVRLMLISDDNFSILQRTLVMTLGLR
ncbi:conserved exported hypothetical protein [Candidatus Terasakiella magnetica]|uniref:Phytase-like domain-containing protein n=1 Tax=Candidatus Terasakiella magnetica TaxID=1867952 RepID=A0A1C3RL25_9PROT|nr:esterase-like activity of phytase family protein [Candidatus Terasakiella magnetica]SCA57943.1 conserved exported hypothetical protein [Candidatus Terasakiella magnetica]